MIEGVYRFWTEEEIEQLTILSEKYPLKTVAKILGRSEEAVFLKRQRLGIGGFLQNTDMLSRKAVAGIMGVDSNTIKMWERLGLKAYRRGYNYMHKQSELVDFLKAHQELWNGKRVCDATIFMNEEWFREKRKSDPRPKSYFVSSEQISRIQHLRDKGLTLSKIAEEVGCGVGSVKYCLYCKAENVRRTKCQK